MKPLLRILCFLFISQALYPYSLSTTEKIVNGDFSAGATGFNTGYEYTTIYMHKEGRYSITNDPKQAYTAFSDCRDHTTGAGNMAIFNGSETTAVIVWEETINGLVPNGEYCFSYWATSLTGVNSAKLMVYINDQLVSPLPSPVPLETCVWNQFVFFWNSGASDVAKITLKNVNLEFNGNDFALDDISFRVICVDADISCSDKTICFGEAVKLGMDNPPMDPQLAWKWFPSTGLSADNVPNPIFTGTVDTRYYLTVTDTVSDCSTYDTIDVFLSAEIPKIITADKDGTVCPCDSIKLTGPAGNYTYLWSTGESTQSVYIKSSGNYSLTVTSPDGCSVKIDKPVEIANSRYSVSADSITANVGGLATVNIRVDTPYVKDICQPKYYSYNLRYDNSTLTPYENSYPVTDYTGYSVITVTGTTIEDILETFYFKVTLGNSAIVPITLENFAFDCKEIIVTPTNGFVKIGGLCTEPTPRLFKDTGVLYLKMLSPNPAADFAKIEFGIIEKGVAHLLLTDAMGNVVSVSEINNVSPGIHTYDLDLSNFSSGIYYILLRTTSQSITGKLSVIK